MITKKPSRFPLTSGSAKTTSVPVSPSRHRNIALMALSGTLLLGMFSIASAANRSKDIPEKVDAVAAAQTEALMAEDDFSLDSLQQLRASNPRNGIYSYLIAAYHSRHKEWEPAIAAMIEGNEAPELVLAHSTMGRGGYPALPVLRQLFLDVAEEARQRDRDEIQEQLLLTTGIVANRLAHDAMPCDLPVLQSAGQAWQTVENARIVAWERDDRFADVSTARVRLANREEWIKQVNVQRKYVDSSDDSVRVAVATQLRAHLPH